MAYTQRKSTKHFPTRIPTSRTLIITLPLLLSLISIAAVQTSLPTQSPLSPSSNENLAQHVYSIFQTHCAPCHGPTVNNPPAGFNFILNLQKLRTSPGYVKPNNPQNSLIYQLVSTHKMPPADSDVPPLSEPEILTIRNWILTGAPANLPTLSQAPTNTSSKSNLSLGHRLLTFLGQLHPPSTHFPIALLLTTALAELILIKTQKPTMLSIVRFILWVATLTAIPTVILGWLNAYNFTTSASTNWILQTHRWLGTSTAILSVLALLTLETTHRKKTSRTLFRIILFTSAIFVSATGFLGGALVFGINHLAW